MARTSEYDTRSHSQPSSQRCRKACALWVRVTVYLTARPLSNPGDREVFRPSSCELRTLTVKYCLLQLAKRPPPNMIKTSAKASGALSVPPIAPTVSLIPQASRTEQTTTPKGGVIGDVIGKSMVTHTGITNLILQPPGTRLSVRASQRSLR